MRKNRFVLPFALAGMILVGAFFGLSHLNKNNGSQNASRFSAPLENTVILSGVEKLDISPLDYPRDLDFGKGKFALFVLHLPQGEDFRLEKLIALKRGVTDAEMPEAWLRINAIRVYTKALFRNDVAEFTVFPPDKSPEPPGISDAEKDIPKQVFQNVQETQFLLLPERELPQIFTGGSEISFGIYGKWANDIAARPFSSGIQFCLEEISGTFLPSGKAGETRLASPLCWPYMGIK